MERKSAHFWLFVSAVVISVAITYWYSDLTKDVPTTFATVTGFATVFGVASALIEIVRARSAAVLAAAEAKRAAASVRALYGIGSLSECQSCIEYALEGIDKEGQVSLSPLSRIVKLYISEFHDQYALESSHHRENVLVLQSYASLRQINKPTHRLREALLSMMADLSASAGKKTSGDVTQ